MRNLQIIILLLVVAAGSTGCGIRKAMHDQEKFEPLESTDFFGDLRSSRNLVEGTIPRGFLRDDSHRYTGFVGDQAATNFPDVVTLETLQRGQERYEIFCSVCHGHAGYGDGMVVRRGYKAPPSFHQERLRASAPGYYYNVINNGFGVMASYADQIPVDDRWAIIAYLKALQFSQHASLEDVPETERANLAAVKE